LFWSINYFKNEEKTVMSNQVKRRAALAAIISTLGLPAFAQTGSYPNRPIKIIMPWAAGGGGDVIVRMLAPSLSKRLGQPVVVENRPGAIGTIGSLAAARSPADGYTLVYGAADSHSIAPHILKQIPYDAKKDFVAIAPIGYPPLALVVSASSPAKNFEHFMQMAKAAKEPLTFGSWGLGGSGHITMEAFKQVTRVNLLHVPYNGTAPLIQAQLGNQIDCSINTLPVVEQHVRNGQLRLLAVAAKERISQFPDAPLLKEMGVPIEMGPWLGFLAPTGVPDDILNKLHEAIDASFSEPAIVEQMKKMTMFIEHIDRRSYNNFYQSEFDRWGQYIRTANIKLD